MLPSIKDSGSRSTLILGYGFICLALLCAIYLFAQVIHRSESDHNDEKGTVIIELASLDPSKVSELQHVLAGITDDIEFISDKKANAIVSKELGNDKILSQVEDLLPNIFIQHFNSSEELAAITEIVRTRPEIVDHDLRLSSELKTDQVHRQLFVSLMIAIIMLIVAIWALLQRGKSHTLARSAMIESLLAYGGSTPKIKQLVLSGGVYNLILGWILGILLFLGIVYLIFNGLEQLGAELGVYHLLIIFVITLFIMYITESIGKQLNLNKKLNSI